MGNKVAFLFPGQGAQYPGMMKDFCETFPTARAVFDEADALLGYPFSKLIFEGPAEELTLTKNSQLAIYIASIAILHVIQEQMPELKPSVCAGLSLGEYTALTASGKISFADCLFLVRDRANLMHEACETHPGTMQVVLGLDETTIAKVLNDSVWIANLNCPGQVVISGTLSAIEEVGPSIKALGAKRILPLDVSGAFHSGLMQSAKVELAPKIGAVNLYESATGLVMNVPGDYVTSLEQIRTNLIDQVTSAVRWEAGIRAMVRDGVDCFIEIGCGKTLSGMNKRIGVTAPTLSVEKVSDLQLLQTVGGRCNS